MTRPCDQPIPFARLVDYWAGDLGVEEIDRIDEHVLGCGHCAAESASIAGIASAFREWIPPVVSAAQVAELAARGLVVVENGCLPGARTPVRFDAGVDLLVHRLAGLDLARATRVRVVVRVESSGDIMIEDDGVPFDRARGEVLIACQRHFAAFPPDVLFEVHSEDDTGTATMTRYAVPHEFADGPAT